MPLLGAAWELLRPGPLTLGRAWRAARKAVEPEPPEVLAMRRLSDNVRDGAGLINDVLPDVESDDTP